MNRIERQAAALCLGAFFSLLPTVASAAMQDIADWFRGPPPRTTVVLVDASGSINTADREIYLQSLQAVGETLAAGDRVLVARVGDQSRSDFRAASDITVKQTGIRLDEEEAVEKARAELAQRAAELIAPENAKSTRIMEAITAAAEAFGPVPREGGYLLLLTDAVEESDLANFARTAPNETAIASVLQKAKKAGLVPDLQGVNVSLVGAGGSHYAEIEQFWRAYFAETGATLKSYGRLPYRGAD